MKYGLSYTLITGTTGFLSRTLAHFRKTELDYMCEFIERQKGKRVLDFGCNNGHFLRRLNKRTKENNYCGADINEYALKRARKKHPYAKFYKADDSFFKKEKFDTIVMSHVLEHIEERQEIIDKFHAMLNKGGHLILAIPQERIRGDATVFQYAYNILRLRFVNPHIVKLDQKDLDNLTKKKFKRVQHTYTNYGFPFRSKKRRIDAWSLVAIYQKL